MGTLTPEEIELLWRKGTTKENDVYAPIRAVRPDQDKSFMGICYRDVDQDKSTSIKVRLSPANYVPYCMWDVALAGKLPDKNDTQEVDGYVIPKLKASKNKKGLILRIIQIFLIIISDIFPFWLPFWFDPAAYAVLQILATTLNFLMGGPIALIGLVKVIGAMPNPPMIIAILQFIPLHTIGYVIRRYQVRQREKKEINAIVEKAEKITQYRLDLGVPDAEVPPSEIFRVLYSGLYKNYKPRSRPTNSFLKIAEDMTYEPVKQTEYEKQEGPSYTKKEMEKLEKALIEKGYTKAEAKRAIEKGSFEGVGLEKSEVKGIIGGFETDIEKIAASMAKPIPVLSQRYRRKIRL